CRCIAGCTRACSAVTHSGCLLQAIHELTERGGLETVMKPCAERHSEGRFAAFGAGVRVGGTGGVDVREHVANSLASAIRCPFGEANRCRTGIDRGIGGGASIVVSLGGRGAGAATRAHRRASRSCATPYTVA